MRQYAIVRHARFHADLKKQLDWWAERNPLRAAAILDAAEGASMLLGQFPELGHPVQMDGGWSMTTRSFGVGETGYVIRYRVEHDRTRIVLLHFRHQAQRPLKR